MVGLGKNGKAQISLLYPNSFLYYNEPALYMGTSGKGNPAGFYAKDRQGWREWLEKTHANEKVYGSEAICFGWIDSKPKKRDDESSFLLFS